LQEELQKEIHASNSVNGAFVKVFGKEHNGYVQGLGLGVTPSQIFGHSSRPSSVADAKIAKMQSEIDVLSKQVAEVEALKAKVAEFEQLKEQFAFIMANIKGNHVSQYSLCKISLAYYGCILWSAMHHIGLV
jgi:hypothetical protein